MTDDSGIAIEGNPRLLRAALGSDLTNWRIFHSQMADCSVGHIGSGVFVGVERMIDSYDSQK